VTTYIAKSITKIYHSIMVYSKSKTSFVSLLLTLLLFPKAATAVSAGYCTGDSYIDCVSGNYTHCLTLPCSNIKTKGRCEDEYCLWESGSGSTTPESSGSDSKNPKGTAIGLSIFVLLIIAVVVGIVLCCNMCITRRNRVQITQQAPPVATEKDVEAAEQVVHGATTPDKTAKHPNKTETAMATDIIATGKDVEATKVMKRVVQETSTPDEAVKHPKGRKTVMETIAEEEF